MNNNKIDELIKEKGVKKNFLAAKLGMSYPSLYKRLNGQADWKAGEVLTICKILGLSKQERQDIFFT